MKTLLTVLVVFCLFSISGCSWFAASKNEVLIQPPPKVTHFPSQKAKKIQRELGSLWSEDSNWNQMYSPTQTRAPGDIVTIKVDKKFLSRLEQAIKRPDPEPVASSEDKKDSKDKKDKKEMKDVPALAASADSGQASEGRGPASLNNPTVKLPETVEVTIVEALPRGGYRVAANHGFKPAADAPFVYIQGVIREREIAEDDSAPSDALLDLKFESINRDMKVTTTDEGDQR